MSGSISIVNGQKEDRQRTLKLAGDIDVFLATELHRRCVQIYEGASGVTVDCDQVTSLDIAALQIMVALNDATVARGDAFSMSGLSQEVRDAVHLAGLGHRLGLNCASAKEADVR
jgi:anti-anti-sigma factor